MAVVVQMVVEVLEVVGEIHSALIQPVQKMVSFDDIAA
jgi:hypothetical protein